MGADYYGAPGDESILLNHALLFLPLGSREIVPDLSPYTGELRAIFARDGVRAASKFAMAKGGPLGHEGLVFTDPFHPGYTLKITAPAGDAPVKPDGYLRTTDFTTGEVSARWRDASGTQDRRLFVSRPDNVAVFRLRGSDGVSVDLRIDDIPESRVRAYTLNRRIPADSPAAAANALVHQEVSATASGMTLHNIYTQGKGGYDGSLRMIVRGGKVTAAGTVVSIRGAGEILILSRLVPFTDPASSNLADLASSLNALPADYDALLARHAKIHGELFNRVSVDFEATAADRRLTTDELLARAARDKKLSPALLEKIHDGSRYVILCASGIRPPNLQGIWSGTWQPAWSGDYTLDTNLQLAIAHALSSGTPELLRGYFDLIEASLPDWRLNARNLWGARGIMAPIRESNTGKSLHWSDRFQGGIFWTAGAGWLGNWFYDYYLYTGDRDFLAKHTVPYLKEVAAFYEDFLVTDPDGTLRFTPSYSPENGTFANSTMDIAVARQVFTNLIAACRELKIEAASIPRWETLLAHLPAYRIADNGELLEWAGPAVPNQDNHRHMSHLYPLQYSFEFDPATTATLWAASEKAYEARLDTWFRNPENTAEKKINETSTHGRMHLALAAARLGRPADVSEILTRLVTGGAVLPSMATSHYEQGRTFNMDANGALPEIIHDCLAFSLPGRLDLLPALPAELPSGTIRGLRLRGAVTIDELTWSPHKVALTLRSLHEQTLVVTLSGRTQSVHLPADESVSLTLPRP